MLDLEVQYLQRAGDVDVNAHGGFEQSRAWKKTWGDDAVFSVLVLVLVLGPGPWSLVLVLVMTLADCPCL